MNPVALVGMIVAGITSFNVGNTITWVGLHALFGWFYVMYFHFGILPLVVGFLGVVLISFLMWVGENGS